MNKTSIDDEKSKLLTNVEELRKTVEELGTTSEKVNKSEILLYNTIENLINYIKTLQGAETTAADQAKIQITKLGGVIKEYETNNKVAIEKLKNIKTSIITNKNAIERALEPTESQKIALQK